MIITNKRNVSIEILEKIEVKYLILLQIADLGTIWMSKSKWFAFLQNTHLLRMMNAIILRESLAVISVAAASCKLFL